MRMCSRRFKAISLGTFSTDLLQIFEKYDKIPQLLIKSDTIALPSIFVTNLAVMWALKYDSTSKNISKTSGVTSHSPPCFLLSQVYYLAHYHYLQPHFPASKILKLCIFRICLCCFEQRILLYRVPNT